MILQPFVFRFRDNHLVILLWMLILGSAGCGGSRTVELADELPGGIDWREACGEQDLQSELLEGQINENTVSFVTDQGLTVIVKQTPGNPVVAMQLFIAGGCRNWTSETAGIETVALDLASNGGTRSTPKAEFHAILDSMGSTIGFSMAEDYSVLSVSTLRVFLEPTWELFRQVILEPEFSEQEVETTRTRRTQRVLMRVQQPDTRLFDLTRERFYQDHPYQNRTFGSAESLQTFSRDDLASYWENLLVNTHLVLVIVGDIEPDLLASLVEETFSALTGERAPLASPPPFNSSGPAYVLGEATIPTNYVLGLAPAPAPGHADYPAMTLAVDHLSERLFEQVRTVRNLAYSVSAGMAGELVNYSYLYVSTTDPAAALEVMEHELARLRETLLTAQEIQDLISVYTTGYYRRLDSNAKIARTLGFWHLAGGGYEQADEYVAGLQRVSPADIQRVAQQYLSGYVFGAVGRASDLEAGIFSSLSRETND